MTQKAWTIIGYSLDGETYCTECGENGDAITEGEPIFASDETPQDWSCRSCDTMLKQVGTIAAMNKNLHTHFVISYNHDTKTFTFDGDGSREWIRRLFTPESNTWSDDEEQFIGNDLGLVTDALLALEKLGVTINEPKGWLER